MISPLNSPIPLRLMPELKLHSNPKKNIYRRTRQIAYLFALYAPDPFSQNTRIIIGGIPRHLRRPRALY
ncbi:MAG: hypothetical protein RR733_03960 [Victivallaceae bacterium]